jgi:lipoteichoic acid synthase
MTEQPRGQAARGALRLGLLGTPLVLASLTTKAHKTLRLHGTVLDGVAAVASDFVFLGAFLLVAAVVAGVFARASRRPWSEHAVATPLHTVFAALTAFLVVEHAFFLTTGAVGDAYLLVETGRRWDEVGKIVLSELTPLRGFLLLLPFTWSLFAAWIVARDMVPLRPNAVGPDAGGVDEPRPLPLHGRLVPAARILPAALLVLGLGLSALPLSPDLAALARAPVWATASDLVRILFEREEIAGAVTRSEAVELRPVPGKARAKNVLFVVLESTSAKSTGLYAPHAYPTATPVAPFLAGLRKEGALVETAYSIVPHTSKALVGIHCGIYPKFDIRIEEAQEGGIPGECLPRLLRDQGMRTAFFQSAEQSYENRSELVREMGFEHFVGKESIDARGYDESSYFGYEDDALIAPALDWMGKQTEPFFASMLTVTSHHPYSVPRGFPQKKLAEDRRLSDYLNTVAYSDRFVSKLWAGLKKAGLTENTLVVITGDHGEAFGEHGRFQHDSTLYDETLRVPLLLAGAGVTAGATVKGLRQHIDLLPTAVDVLGYEATRPLLGKSLFAPLGHASLFTHCHYQRFCRAVREPDRKYIDNYGRRGPEVYDLARDPDEKKNLLAAKDPALLAKMNAITGDMERITRRTNKGYNAHSRSRRSAYVSSEKPKILHPLEADFGPVSLLGYDLEPAVMDAGGTAFATLYYRVDEKPPAGLVPFFHVFGHKKIDYDHAIAGGSYPMKDWEPGMYIRDRFPMRTRDRYPAQSYELVTGFTEGGKARVVPVVKAGTPVRDRAVVVGAFKLTQPKINPSDFVRSEAPPLPSPTAFVFGDVLELVSATLDRHEVKAGIKVRASFVWHVLKSPAKDTSMAVHFIGPGSVTLPHVPVHGTLPFGAWQPGQYIVDEAEFLLSERQKSGEYRVLFELRTGGRPLVPSGAAPRSSGVRLKGKQVDLGALRITRL